MASDRLFLIHRPTNIGVPLGKHMNAGWYAKPNQGELLYEFYKNVSVDFPEDLYLFIETQDNLYIYGEALPNGLRKFIPIKSAS